jgi:hypothetical protein
VRAADSSTSISDAVEDDETRDEIDDTDFGDGRSLSSLLLPRVVGDVSGDSVDVVDVTKRACGNSSDERARLRRMRYRVDVFVFVSGAVTPAAVGVDIVVASVGVANSPCCETSRCFNDAPPPIDDTGVRTVAFAYADNAELCGVENCCCCSDDDFGVVNINADADIGVDDAPTVVSVACGERFAGVAANVKSPVGTVTDKCFLSFSCGAGKAFVTTFASVW